MDDNKIKVVPKRKRTRLKGFDYRSNGAYFVTICVKNRKCILSNIVGQGLAPAVNKLTQYGKIAENNILLLEQRYKQIKIESYAIMPNHIHILVFINNMNVGSPAGASPCPTLSDIICSFKSLTTIECRKNGYNNPILFQSSFHDHIIRGEEDYKMIYNYIESNPSLWAEDCFYVE